MKTEWRVLSGFIPSTLNNTMVLEKLWNGACCILVLNLMLNQMLNLIKDSACIFLCPHKLTSS